MSELWIRLVIVAGAAIVAGVVVLLMRRRGRRPGSIHGGGLSPGIYLFSSSTCADCAPARERLEQALGRSGFVEVRWEEHAALFDDVGIDVVPCTVLVSEEGRAARFPGMPDRALERLSP